MSCGMCEGTGQVWGKRCILCKGTGQILKEIDVQKFTLLHTFRNEWRQRQVYIYEHPTDTDKVITMGYQIAASGGVTTIPPVICIEKRLLYEQIIKQKIKRIE